jgi:hypothetical protein
MPRVSGVSSGTNTMAFGKHCIEVFHELRIDQANNSWIDVRIICEHPAIEPVFQLSGDLRADIAEPNDAYRFSL